MLCDNILPLWHIKNRAEVFKKLISLRRRSLLKELLEMAYKKSDLLALMLKELFFVD